MTEQQAKIAQVATSSPQVFKRKEKKYLLGGEKWQSLVAALGAGLQIDDRGSTLITSLYLDTADRLLIRRSVEKPDFKEKLRIRAYGNLFSDQQPVYLENKKKLVGTVYKRRVCMTMQEARHFVESGIMPTSPFRANTAEKTLNCQILNEMLWTLERYDRPKPAIRLSYERCAYTYHEGGAALRLTVDCAIKYRPGSWVMTGEAFEDAQIGSQSEPTYEDRPLLPQGSCLMEIKCSGSMPLGLSKVMAKLDIYPQSFSKVGRAYMALENEVEL
ncbi:MAG TPA: molecular chaperone [Coriobacteriia bacterium]|nr:molecular chaperone [Coriobacteriia bacterium]